MAATSITPYNFNKGYEEYNPPPATPVNLLRGHPSTHLLATAPFLAATVVVLGQPEDLPQDGYSKARHPLAYGPGSGNWTVRRELIRWQEELYRWPAQRVFKDDDEEGGARAGAGAGDATNVLSEEEEEEEGDDLEPEARINLTCGASFGLMDALNQCTSTSTGYTRRAFIIAPTYFLVCKIFADAGFADLFTSIPYPCPPGRTMPEMLLDALKADVQQQQQQQQDTAPNLRVVGCEGGLKPSPLASGDGGGGKRIYKYVLYCVPTYGNPTGCTWDLETRQRVVEIARDWDILVLCDDVYDFLTWPAPKTTPEQFAGAYTRTGGIVTGIPSPQPSSPPPPPPLPRLVTIDRQFILASGRQGEDAGNVISNCSFSKLLGPGLRCGWQETATPVLAQQLARAGTNISGGCPSHFVSNIIYELIRPQTPPPPPPPPLQQQQQQQQQQQEEEAEEAGEAEEEVSISSLRSEDRGGGGGAEDEPKGVRKRTRKIDAIIQDVALTLGARATAIVDAVYTYLPLGSEVFEYQHPPEDHPAAAIATSRGGYFLWIAIGPDKSQPGAVNVREVLKLASQGELHTSRVRGRDAEDKEDKEDKEEQQRGEARKKHAPEAGAVEAQWINRVTVGNGDLFECPGKGSNGQSNWLGFGDRWIRVSVSWYGIMTGVEGIRRLGRAVERWKMGERVVEVQ